MPTAIATTTATHRDTKSATVYVRTLWADNWTEVTHFYPDWLVFAVSPNMSSAGFSYDYGVGMRQGETSFATIAPQELRGKYVKVSIDQYVSGEGEEAETITLDWYGRIREEDRDVHGTMLSDPAGGSARVPKGRQTMLADGLEVLLDKAEVLTSWWLRDGVDTQVGRGLIFNGPHQVGEGVDPATTDEGHKNRTPDGARGNKGVHVFAGQLEEAESWSTRNIVEHLVAYHSPKDKDGGDALQWRIGTDEWGADQFLPDWDRPVVPTHGRSVRDLLNTVIDRRRGLGWKLVVEEGEEDEDPDILVIVPVTHLAEDLNLPSGDTLPASVRLKTLDFDEAVDVSRAEIKVTQAQQYDQVVAQGDRVLCCGTIRYEPEEFLLAKAWTDEHETEYDEAASVNTGAGGVRDPNAAYDDWDVQERQRRNNLVRAADHLEAVYSHWRLHEEWDGKVIDVLTGVTYKLFPIFGESLFEGIELADNQQPWYRPDLRFYRRLPLQLGYDYSEFTGSNPEIRIKLPDEHKLEHRRTYVLIKVIDEDPEAEPPEPARWVQAEKLETVVDTSDGLVLPEGAEPESYDFSCNVRVMDDAAGFVLRTSGKAQHFLAAVDWDKLDEDYDVVILDWRTDMIATVAMQADWHVEKRYPAEITDETDAVKLLTIKVPERAKLEYVAQGTVVDTTNDGQLVQMKDGGFVRDDREWLADLAKIAWEWYGEERSALTLTYDQAQTLFSAESTIEPGDLIVEIGGDESLQAIRTMVTEIRIDFAPEIEGEGPGQPHRTIIRTQWAELDPTAVM